MFFIIKYISVLTFTLYATCNNVILCVRPLKVYEAHTKAHLKENFSNVI